MTAVGRSHDTVHAQFPLGIDRHLGARSDIAAKAVGLGETAEHLLAVHIGGRLAPSRALGHRVQHRQVLGVSGHQLAAQFKRILIGCRRNLVNEALEVDGVLVEVDPAPETRRHVRIAHGVVDQHVREAVADHRLAAAFVQTLKDHRVFAVLDVLRENARKN